MMRNTRNIAVAFMLLGTCAATSWSLSVEDRINAAPTEGRLPVFPQPTPFEANGLGPPAMDEMSVAQPLAQGSLLVPVEEDPAYARPDLIFVYSAQKLRIFAALTGAELTAPGKEIPLPLRGSPPLLLGYQDGIAVIAQRTVIVGIDLKTLTIAWKQSFEISPGAPSGLRKPPETTSLRPSGTGPIGPSTQPALQKSPLQVDTTTDPETARLYALTALQRPTFSGLKMLGDNVLIISEQQLVALNIQSGKSAWVGAGDGAKQHNVQLPAGESGIIVGNAAWVVAEVDTDSATRLVVADAKTAAARTIELPGEKVYWRGVTDDGILVLITNKGTIGYDLTAASTPRETWRRADLLSRYPTASQVTGTTITLIKDADIALSLDGKTGKILWSSDPLPFKRTPADPPPSIRSVKSPERVFYVWPYGVVAVGTQPQKEGGPQIDWSLMTTPQNSPPFVGMRLSDPLLIIYAVGPVQTAQRAVHLLMVDTTRGKRVLDKPIRRSPNGSDLEGPLVRAWDVVDNGIVMEVNGTIYSYRGQIAPPPTPAPVP